MKEYKGQGVHRSLNRGGCEAQRLMGFSTNSVERERWDSLGFCLHERERGKERDISRGWNIIKDLYALDNIIVIPWNKNFYRSRVTLIFVEPSV